MKASLLFISLNVLDIKLKQLFLLNLVGTNEINVVIRAQIVIRLRAKSQVCLGTDSVAQSSRAKKVGCVHRVRNSCVKSRLRAKSLVCFGP